MQYLVTIALARANEVGFWANARKIFKARSVQEAQKKAIADLLKSGLHYEGDYVFQDIRGIP